jgi:gliding motility-associated-like protein
VAGEEHLPNAHVIVPAGQTAAFHWIISNGTCFDSAAVTITNYMQPVAAVAGTADTASNCDNSVFTMHADAASPATAQGTWTFNAGSAATLVNPADLHNPAAQINVPVGDSATAYWTVTNGLCSSVDSIKLYSYELPAQADAGTDRIEHCEIPTFNLTAVTPNLSYATAKWSVANGPATFTSDSTLPSVTVNLANGNSAMLYWTITNGSCETRDSVYLVNYAMPAQANAGPDSLEQCNNASFTMQAVAASPAPAVGKWSLYPGSAASFPVADSTNPAAVFTLPVGDTATATWTVSNGVCSNFDRVLLKNYEAPTPADAGADSLKHCADGVFTLSGNQPTPVATATGVWTLSNTRATITGATTQTPTVTVPVGDSVIAYWTITNGTCTTVDQVILFNYERPDTAAAGPDQHQCDNPNFTMAANTPSVASATGLWTVPAGSTAVIANPTSPTTGVTIPVGDSSMLFWTITNGVCVDTDTVWIANNTRPADAAAGVDISQCNNDQFLMAANAPSVSDATGTWTVVSPATYTIPAAEVNNPTATFTVPAGTTVVLRWTITNLGCTSSDDITLINYEQPTAVSAGTDQAKCAGTDFQLSGSPVTIAGATGTWYVRSLDASNNINATIRAGEEHLPNAHVTVPNNTTAELHWVVTNGECADSAAVFLTNFLTPVKASVGVDSMKHCNDSAFVMVANAADVAGSVGNWSFILPTTAFVQADDTTNEHATIIVPAGDSAYAIWTIGNGSCSTSDTIKLVNYMAPTAAAVPGDMQQCMTDQFPVTANAPDVPNAFGTWKLVAGNGTFPAADLHNNSTTFTVANGDTAYFSWTLTNGICESSDTIRLYNYQQPVQADAGVDSLVQCNTNTFTMNAVAASPAPSIGKWSLYPGSAASFNTTDSTNIHAVITLPAGDTATAIWTVTNGVCSSYDVILLKNYEAPAPTDAGPDSIKHCNDDVFNMTATAPLLPTAYGVWTLSNTNATIAPADTSNPLAVIRVPAGDSVIATWTVKNGTCSTSDIIKLVNYQQPTAAAAGTDARQCATAAFTMNANTPDVTGAVGTWTLPAATTATITAGDEHKPNAVINVPVGVTVTATWTIANGVCSSSSDVILTNDSLPAPAAAGPSQVHCNDSSFIMAGNTPSVTTATGLWTLLPGAAAVITPGDENKPDAQIIVLAGDTATATWTITNGNCSTSSTVFLQNDRMPEDANAGTDQTHCNDAVFHLAAVPGTLPGAVGTWEVISGTTMAAADIHNPTATVNVAAGQTAVLRWTLGNGTCTGKPDTVTLINQENIIGNTISADQLLCENSTPAPLTGTATLNGGNGTFTYQWEMSTTSATTGFANVSSGTGGTAATYQPAALTMTTDTIWFRRLVTSGVCANSTSNVVMLHIINKAPVGSVVADTIFANCVAGTDYTSRYVAPSFNHSPFNGEALTLSVINQTITNTPCLTQIKRTWIATDRCLLADSVSQVISIRDTSAPKFTTPAPANVTVDCDKIPAMVNLQAYDSCSGAAAAIAPIEVRRDVAGQCSSNYTLIRKWVAVDGCGNASDTLYQYITVRDTTRPVFTTTVPANVTVDCNSVPTAPVMTATDNCTPGTITATVTDVQKTVTGACAGTYTITRTWTAADNCGNTTTATQVITVQDRTKPTIQTGAARDTLVDCDKVIPIPALVFTDNCNPNPTVTFTETKVNLSTTCTNNYQLIRTWVASDGCNDTTVIQRVTVQDTTKPRFTVPMPGDTTVSCGAIPKPLTIISAADNCGTVTMDFKETRETNTGACAGSYRIIRVYTATDNCKNAFVHRQVITVVDTTAPVIDVAPANVTVQCGGSLPAVATLYATDNCDGNFPRKATMTVDPYTVDICNGYTITRRWNIADQCGNMAIERVQVITVEACPKPTLDANLPLNCSDNTKFALQLTTKVSKPKFTLQSVSPAGAVTTPLTQSSNVFDLKGATQATFIVTDGVTGCVSDPVTYNLQYLTRPVVNLGNDVDICKGSTVTLDAGAANAAAGYAIMWSTGATSQQITVSTAGTYTVTVTNLGCSSTSTVKVTVNEPPTVNLRDTTICENTSVKLSAYVQGASYAWSTGETTSNITVNTGGTYTVDVSLKGCTVTAQSTVFVATPPVVQLTPDTAICPGGSVTLRVEPDGGTVKWSDNSVANTISVSRPGTYWVTVTKNSCVVGDTVKVNNKGNITFDLGPDKDICAGGLVVLSAQHPDVISYLWNDGTTNPVKEVSTPGKYTVTVLERFCNTTLTDSVNVTVAGIEPFSLGNDTTICMGQTLTLKVDAGSGNSIRWQDNSTNETFVVSTAGYYTVTVYNDCGSLSDDITVTYKQCETNPTFPNAFTPNGDGNNDKFKPHVNGPMYDYDLRVFNRWGQIVWMSKDATSGWDGRNHGSLVDVGTYVYLLTYKSTAGGKTIVVKGEVTVIR